MSFLHKHIFFLFCFFSFTTTVFAASIKEDLPKLIYYDADSILIKQNMNLYEFNGNAAFMMGDLFLQADKIFLQKEEKLITAEGHVKIIYKKTQATASKILYDGNTKQIRMDNAKVYSDPNSKENAFERDALGFTKAEIAFEQERQVRKKEILKELQNIRVSYANLQNLLTFKKEDTTIPTQLNALEEKYSGLLERYIRVTSEQNTYFATIPESDKTKYIERRAALEKFNREYPNMAEKILNFSDMPSYIYVSASQIIQKSNDNYILNDTFITPCNCGTSKVAPIFGFSAQKGELDLGNYMTMEAFTLDIFRVPVFYLPWTKLSIKNKRENGLLYPSGYLSNNAGFAVNFPLFLTLGEHADSTTTYQYFSERGSRFMESIRVSFLDTSLLYVNGNTAFDRLYPEQWATNKENVENAIAALDPTLPFYIETLKEYQGFIGNDATPHWYGEASWNIPVFDFASIKLNGQVVSDNTYIANYESSTNIDPMSSVYGNTTPASRRFLNQEIDAEYYGNNIVFSARSTRFQDLFALNQNEAPTSLPLVEFTLLPANYLNLPIVISNKSAFEDVISHNIKGKRFASSSFFTLNLPYNNYVNSYLQFQETFVQYYSPTAASASHTNPNPYEVYSRFSWRTEIPFYGTSIYKNKKKGSEIIVQQNYIPFVELSYIPTVTRSSSFPYTYQLWYADDNKAKEALISGGFSWSLNIKKSFNKAIDPILINILNSKIADTDILAQVLQQQNDIPAAQNTDALFQMSNDAQAIQATRIYTKWAQLELHRYYAEFLKSKFNQTEFIPTVDDSADFNFTPLGFRLFSNYNILANQTANELNQIAGPLFSPYYVPQKFGDMSAEFNWNLLPFVGWDGTVLYSYSFAYHRTNTLTASSNFALGAGVAGTGRYQILFIVDPREHPFTTRNSTFIRKTFLNFGLSYTPKPFIKFGFEWALNTDPTFNPERTALSAGRTYGSSFYINLLNIQDCMDITFARNKPAGVSESQATYAIGINVKFFGHSMKFNQIGNYINNLVQSR